MKWLCWNSPNQDESNHLKSANRISHVSFHLNFFFLLALHSGLLIYIPAAWGKRLNTTCQHKQSYNLHIHSCTGRNVRFTSKLYVHPTGLWEDARILPQNSCHTIKNMPTLHRKALSWYQTHKLLAVMQQSLTTAPSYSFFQSQINILLDSCVNVVITITSSSVQFCHS